MRIIDKIEVGYQTTQHNFLRPSFDPKPYEFDVKFVVSTDNSTPIFCTITIILSLF